MIDSPQEGEGKNPVVNPMREQGFFDKSMGIRLLIAVFFVFFLFTFLHFREVRVEVLELNNIAERYIVAQVDFEFPDEETTLLLKQEAARDIGKLYKVSDKDVRLRRKEFEKYLAKDERWRKQVEHSTFEEMYRAIGLFEEAMLKSRFTDGRTLHKMRESRLPTRNFLLFIPPSSEERTTLSKQVWKHLEQVAFHGTNIQSGAKNFILSFFRDHPWKMEEDNSMLRQLRKQVQARIPVQYTKVEAGDRMIDQGEKVTARHLAMLLAMKKSLTDSRNLWHPMTLLGSLSLTLIFSAMFLVFCKKTFPEVTTSNRKLFLLVSILLLTLVLAKITEYFLIRSTSPLIEVVCFPIFVPFTGILLRSLMNTGIATFSSGFMAVILSMVLAVDHIGFLIINLVASFTAILSTSSLRKRKEVFIVCGKAWVSSVAVICAFHLYGSTYSTPAFGYDMLSTLAFMTFIAILVVGVLPLLESFFHIMTDITLMEYMDPNNELLRRLTIEAPGTYQHSIVVGNLSEAAALSIGANGLFCRVSTLYHDVGKLVTPHYFTENQQMGVNMHQLLTPLESAQVIIGHVSEGVAMARKAGLPEPFIDIIKEHHGTTFVYYFYRKQLELMGGDENLVDAKDYRYSGPKPRTKESAIIMIADTLEAASRSLDELNEATVRELVTNIVNEKAEDGQFDECLLTFEELSIVKETMIKTLVVAGHSRIKYPKRKKEKPAFQTPEQKKEADQISKLS